MGRIPISEVKAGTKVLIGNHLVQVTGRIHKRSDTVQVKVLSSDCSWDENFAPLEWVSSLTMVDLVD